MGSLSLRLASRVWLAALFAVTASAPVRHPLDVTRCFGPAAQTQQQHLLDELAPSALRLLTDDLTLISGLPSESTSAVILGRESDGLRHMVALLASKTNVRHFTLAGDVAGGSWGETALSQLYEQLQKAKVGTRRLILVSDGGSIRANNLTSLNVLMRTLDSHCRLDAPQGKVPMAGAALLLFVDVDQAGMQEGWQQDEEHARAAVQAWLNRLSEEQRAGSDPAVSAGTRPFNPSALLGRFRHVLPLPADEQGGWRRKAAEDPGCASPASKPPAAPMSPGTHLGIVLSVIAGALGLLMCAGSSSGDVTSASGSGVGGATVGQQQQGVGGAGAAAGRGGGAQALQQVKKDEPVAAALGRTDSSSSSTSGAGRAGKGGGKRGGKRR